jgi:hypothetical protein
MQNKIRREEHLCRRVKIPRKGEKEKASLNSKSKENARGKEEG